VQSRRIIIPVFSNLYSDKLCIEEKQLSAIKHLIAYAGIVLIRDTNSESR
jgi:hypothetical protein